MRYAGSELTLSSRMYEDTWMSANTTICIKSRFISLVEFIGDLRGVSALIDGAIVMRWRTSLSYGIPGFINSHDVYPAQD